MKNSVMRKVLDIERGLYVNRGLNILLGVAICMLVGFISRLFHDEAMIEWYPYLNKSALNPPDIVFPIVWGVIYLMMGISVGRLYSRRSGAGNGLFWLFATYLNFYIVVNN